MMCLFILATRGIIAVNFCCQIGHRYMLGLN